MANFAQLGIQINSNADDAASDLDRLAAAGGRAEQSTKRLTKATQDQEKEIADLLGKIDPTVAALGRLDEQERKLAQFRKQGAIDSDTFNQYSRHLNEQRELLGKVDSAQRLAGLSAAQYSNAIRMLPAQFTDIFTSLAGGQNPLLVMIQQGGQISDSFGGIGNTLELMKEKFLSLFSISSRASSALDGISDSSSESSDSLSGLSERLNSTSDAAGNARDAMAKVPVASSAMLIGLTAAAAAVAVLGVAFYQASARTEEINLALISTGRNATYTAEGIEKLAASIDSVSGVTQGRAISAITSLATTTQLTGDALTNAAAAAVQWSSATGQSADTVLDKFRAIAKDPVDALTKLNETERFLTETQYQRIKALQDEGKWQEAATEGFKLYSDVVDGRTRQVVESLGLISTTWLNIKRASSEAWDIVVTGVDSALGPLQRYADYLAKIGGAQRSLSATGIGVINPIAGLATYFGGNANRGRPEVIMPGVGGETRTPETVRNEQEQNKINERANALADWSATADKAASRQNTLNQLEQRGIDLGQSRAEIDRVLNQQRAEWAKQDEKKAASAAKAAMADDNSARRMLDNALRQISANNEVAESGEKVTASRRLEIQIEQLLKKEKNKMTAATRAELQAAKESLATTDAQAKARQQLARDTAAGLALEERLAQLYKQQVDQNEIALMGIGRGSQAAEIAQRELNIRRDYLKQVNDLEMAQRNESTALTANELQVEKDMLSAHLQAQLAAEQSYQDQRMAMQADWRNGANAAFEEFLANSKNVAGQYQSLFTSAFEGATDALTKFVTTGKASFKEFTISILADLAKIYARQALVGLVSSIGQSFGPRITGFATGGYTGYGGKHTPAGIVHRGEVVWSQADVKAVGGPKRANAMRPTAGYASGGIVGGGASSSPNNASPTFEININMEGGTVTSQTQNGNTSQDGMQLVNMIKTVVSQWYNEQSRTGGVVYKQQRGMG